MPDPTPNWTKIEHDYRGAQLSIAALCRTYSITRKQLNEYATRYGWTRNLADQVREETQEAILRRSAGPDGGTDTTFVERAADRAADIVLGHRADITKLRELATKMRDRLQVLVGDGVELAEDHKFDKRDVILLGKNQGTITALTSLAEAYMRIIAMERQALGLDVNNAAPDADTIKAMVDEARAELSRRGVAPRKLQ